MNIQVDDILVIQRNNVCSIGKVITIGSMLVIHGMRYTDGRSSGDHTTDLYFPATVLNDIGCVCTNLSTLADTMESLEDL